jgi:hypothetical protein
MPASKAPVGANTSASTPEKFVANDTIKAKLIMNALLQSSFVTFIESL